MGGHTMIHHVDDELMNNWLKNTVIPLELGDEEE